jgi:haloalkane dehalogenase
LYRVLNLSLRVLTPLAYGNRRALTAALYRQILAPFSRRGQDRVLVLHALARALLEARDLYAMLFRERARLAAIPSLLVWGMRDPTFGPAALARARAALPSASVVELANAGHWPHEEAPDDVAAAVAGFVAK